LEVVESRGEKQVKKGKTMEIREKRKIRVWGRGGKRDLKSVQGFEKVKS